MPLPTSVLPHTYDYFQLVGQLLYHGLLYYTLDQPVIPDCQYDEMYRKAQDMEQEQGWAYMFSPTQTVGSPSLIEVNQNYE